MKGFVQAAVCAALIFIVNSAFASFAETHGFSATGIAKGNAVTATVDDWSSVFYNISGLGRTRGGIAIANVAEKTSTLVLKKGAKEEAPAPVAEEKILNDQIGLNFFYTMPKMTIDIPRKDVKAAEDLHYGTMTLGLVLDLNHFYRMPRIISSARFGLGLATMADGYMVKVNDIDLRTHNWLNYGREAQRTVILAGIGIGFFDDLFGIGAGANVWTGGEGAVLMRGVVVSPDPQSPDQQARMDLTTIAKPVAGLYISPGKKVNALRGLDIGISYRAEIYMLIDPFKAGTTLSIPASMQLMMSIFDYYTPHIVSAGIAYNPPTERFKLNRLTIEIDVEYQMWSKYKTSDARRDYWEKGYFGKDAEGDPYFVNVNLPEFKDVIVPKVGISFKAFEWLTAMAGYSYQKSYIPDEALTGIFNMLDNDRHIASFGLRFIIPQMGGMVAPLEINLAGQYQMLIQRDVVKDYSYINLANSDAAADYNDLVAANPNYSFGGSVFSATIEVKLRW